MNPQNPYSQNPFLLANQTNSQVMYNQIPNSISSKQLQNNQNLNDSTNSGNINGNETLNTNNNSNTMLPLSNSNTPTSNQTTHFLNLNAKAFNIPKSFLDKQNLNSNLNNVNLNNNNFSSMNLPNTNFNNNGNVNFTNFANISINNLSNLNNNINNLGNSNINNLNNLGNINNLNNLPQGISNISNINNSIQGIQGNIPLNQNIKNLPINSNSPKYSLSSSNLPQNILINNNNNNSNNNNSTKIIEVYADNFVKEIKRIGKYLKQYPYIGMDTEFPGIVYPSPYQTEDFYYRFTKFNVDKLKLIQLGITLTNEKGETPPNTCTWQFNLKFDCDNDEHSKDSINMLYNCGIDFNLLKTQGISQEIFAEYLVVSGLAMNENVTWICFNGLSDFAYLLKIVTGELLPVNEDEFLKTLKDYFPNIFDIKFLINDNETYKGGLNRLASELNVERNGEMHQAGSDSQVTAEVFFKLINNGIINKCDLTKVKNIIYGVGKGADDQETISYTIFTNDVDKVALLQNITSYNFHPHTAFQNDYFPY